MLEAAEKAWMWAEANPSIAFTNPPDVHTGEYGGSDLASNRAWAAAELYITTREDRYYADFEAEDAPNEVPGWLKSWGLAWMSLAHHMDAVGLTAHAIGLIVVRVMSLSKDIQDQITRLANCVWLGLL